MTERFNSGVIQKSIAGALLHFGRDEPARFFIDVHQDDAGVAVQQSQGLWRFVSLSVLEMKTSRLRRYKRGHQEKCDYKASGFTDLKRSFITPY
jgi:hypothetical protein